MTKSVCVIALLHREKIKTSLQAARMSHEGRGLTAVSLMERANTIRTLPEMNASSGYLKMPGTGGHASVEEVRPRITTRPRAQKTV
jgi:hypothetical protein